MDLKWTPSALDDLDAAALHIAEQDPRAAARMAARVQEAASFLVRFPSLGRPGRVEGTREVVVSGTPLVLIYRVRLDRIEVLRLLHHARKWPPP